MHVVGHEHEANALRRERLELMVQNTEDDPVGMMEVKQPSPPVDGESHEMDVTLILEPPSPVAHDHIVGSGRVECNRDGILQSPADASG